MNQETADEVVRKINALGAKYGTYTFWEKKDKSSQGK